MTLARRVQAVNAVNDSLIALWGFQSPPPDLWPLLYEDVTSNGLVSVGLNPSFSDDKSKGWSHIKDVERLQDVWHSPRAHFKWNPQDRSSFCKEKTNLVERYARERHPFFAPIRKLHQTVTRNRSMEWQHIDMFFLRETDHHRLQGTVFDRYPKEEQPLKLTTFGAAQFCCFEQLLEASEPLVIVIFNALASRLYKQTRHATLRSDTARGCMVDRIAGGEVPVLFSGFPTYMDHFSRERLEWHIGHVLGGV